MSVWILSSLIVLVTVGTLWSSFYKGTVDIVQGSQSDLSSIASNEIEDAITLEDLPPPDDTYTPDQRRYS